ncbi:MAG: winged helix-turn-helix domain-containing protein [Candidatus Bathyarchaeia archaeon]
MRKKDKFLEVLGGKTRLKILITLARSKEKNLTLYKLAKFSGVKKDSIRKNIQILIENGLVIKKEYGAVKLYSLNKENPIVESLIEFFSKTKLL